MSKRLKYHYLRGFLSTGLVVGVWVFDKLTGFWGIENSLLYFTIGLLGVSVFLMLWWFSDDTSRCKRV